jgi:hypothetical protein
MAEAATVSAAATSAVVSGALTGAPPEFLLAAVFIGAALSAWQQHGQAFEARPKWFIDVSMHTLLAVVFGYVGSTLLLRLAPAYDLLKPALLVEPWLWGIALSGTCHWSLPTLQRKLSGGA